MDGSGSYDVGMPGLVRVVQELSLARDLPTVQDIARRAARALTGADGATFVLRDGPNCFYADEDAIEPLWKGLRFPLEMCISGWAMLNRRPAIIEDIYADDRIPHEAYRPTFVKSVAMVPIRSTDPLGAIGNYWARRHQPTESEVALLQALADSTAVAMESVSVRELSLTDDLTGLANRRGFLVRAEQARVQLVRTGLPSALLFVDVDGLKRANDTHGHAAGDELIRTAGRVLAEGLRLEDVVARWGGDEFVAFLPGVADPGEVRRRLADAVDAANRTRSLDPGFDLPLSLSMGVVSIAAHDLRPLMTLVEEADQAMYAEKTRRRQPLLAG